MTPEQARTLTPFELLLIEELQKTRWALEAMVKALGKAVED